MVETGDKIQRKYKNFRGVDFRGEECSLNRSPDSLNVWRNYKKLSCIETRPGLENRYTFTKRIKTMMWHGNKLYFISDDGYAHALCADGTLDEFNLRVGSNAILFQFDGKLYALGDYAYCNITDGKEIEAFVPTTSIARKPAGGGTIYQDVNMLTPFRINTFVADGESKDFYLDAKEIDSASAVAVTVNGNKINSTLYTVDTVNGIIRFKTTDTVPKPSTDGQANVSIRFRKTVSGYRQRITNCTLVQEFDNRVFFSGNPNYPSTVWHSSLHDVSYFSDLDYYVDGVDQAPIRGMVAGNNGLWVFRDVSESNSSVFYHTPALDEDYGKVYPSSHSSIALGCVGRAVNFNDDVVFFSERGMESASTDVTTEQFVTHKSSLVDRKMITHPKYKDMVLAEWEGYLLVFIGSDVYLADSRAVLQLENHIEYEWYHWSFGDYNVTCATVHDGVLYIGMEGKNGEGFIQTLTGDPRGGDKWHEALCIESYWPTPKDTFGAPNKLKTTNKKGCVVEALGDVSLYVRTDDDAEFELIGTAEGIEDYFVSRIKRKKIKDLQLKFHSETSFSLETATLECFIGGYIKR